MTGVILKAYRQIIGLVFPAKAARVYTDVGPKKMIIKKNIKLPIFVAVTSIPIVAIGAHFRETSPSFDKWFQKMASDIHMVDGAGLGMALSTWWVFVMASWVFGIMLFVGLLAVGSALSKNAHINKPLRDGLRGLIILAFVFPIILLSKDIVENCKWGFWMLATGELVTVCALILGILQISVINPKDNAKTTAQQTAAAAAGRGQ